ncbi:MAG: hypothetical protein IPM48_05895 [Saprospiraceae bacterium]|nr:hypothetical protein [Saprospiraceae bacterium]
MKLLKFLLFLLSAEYLHSQAVFHLKLSEEQNELDRREILGHRLFSIHRDLPDQGLNKLALDLRKFDDSTSSEVIPTIDILGEYPEYIYYQDNHFLNGFGGNSRKSLLSSLFRDKHFLSSFGKDGYITLDPLLEVKMGLGNNSISRIPFINRRGIRMTAGIGRKLHIYTQLVETQIGTLNHLEEYVNLNGNFPGASFLKDYSPSFIKNAKAYDFLVAQGAIRYEFNDFLSFTFGQGKHSFGEGLRSLFLSDFAAPRFYLQMNANMGPVNYQSLFYELVGESRYQNGVDRLLRKKYMVSHYLSLNLTDRWSLGFFESVVFNRSNEFELQYLNPVIFYRSIEQAIGSPDNALLGMKSSALVSGNLKAYGQLLLDEFIFGKLFSSPRGWWGNKYAVQLGLKWVDVMGFKHLNLRAEYNMVRPFTYSYSDSLSNYSQLHQSLAHPLGSNFREVLVHFIYQPSKHWSFEWINLYYHKGLDNDQDNFGGNILRPNLIRYSDYGNHTAQGVREKVFYSTMMVSRRIHHRCWIDLDLTGRKSNLSSSGFDFWCQLGLRWNLERESRNWIF